MINPQASPHRVVIIGGGFGGLYAAKALSRSPDVEVTLIDKRNFHLFQPLLYQVATGTLSPADISAPLRSILSRRKNVRILMEKVVDIDATAQTVLTERDAIAYDSLIVATGVSHHYFGNEQWKPSAPGLKTVEDALEMRRRIFLAFEAAEQESDPQKRQAWLTFVIVGGGPTGVELAGAIAELAKNTLKHDFRRIDTREAKILLVEGVDRILPTYPAELSAKASATLNRRGVTVQTQAKVTQIEPQSVTIETAGQTETVAARTILWAAGVKASAMGQVLADRTGASLDRVGRVKVNPDLSVPNFPNLFVIGDLAHCPDPEGNPLPGVAAVAMQEGQYLAKRIKAQLQGKTFPGFVYQQIGNLAVIGRNAAVADFGAIRLSGIMAWFIWVVAHIHYLIEFDNKLVVMVHWAWNYLTRKRQARLITGEKEVASGLEDYPFRGGAAAKPAMEI